MSDPKGRTEAQPATRWRLLGIDPALRCTGFGVIDVEGRNFAAVDCGTIRTPAKAPLSRCMLRLLGGGRELVEAYAPDVAVLESAFYFKNARTAMLLGSAKGVLISVLAQAEIPTYEYAPRRVKQAVCGSGSASKEQVAALVSQLLALDTADIANDATDALAVALCHAHNATTMQGIHLPEPI